MRDWPKRRRPPLDVPHPNSPAGRHFAWSSLGVPHPNSPAGRTFDYWASLGVLHPNSPAGRIGCLSQLGGQRSKFPLSPFFDDWCDFESWASGVADTVKSFLKKEPIELFGDVKLLGGASVVFDAVHEYQTHPCDSKGILGDVGAVEGKLGLTALAPWLAIAALMLDPFLRAQHRPGIMDVAGEAGRTVVQEFIRQFPRDRDAIVWLLQFASDGTRSGSSTASLTNHRYAVTHPGFGRSIGPAGKARQETCQQRTVWSELDKAMAQDDWDSKNQGRDDFNKKK